MMPLTQAATLERLRSDILRLQGLAPAGDGVPALDLGVINKAFPNHTFPTAAMHEFVSATAEAVTAASGFLSGLLSSLVGNTGTALWITGPTLLFPPALAAWGLQPHRFLFLRLTNHKQALWAMEEALKSPALTAVVGEVRDISFTESRRLQLAVEQSRVTGFIINRSRKAGTTACVSRWRITSLPSVPIDNLPGIGFPRWHVELLRIRNGKPGAWEVQWRNDHFIYPTENQPPATNDQQPFQQAG
ncbi:MAG: Error-prone repair protein ImuA [Cyclobacteriaceae bacterium]|jgi:protein ImuA|nr:Error-prone repair protein ImuA [Cyclobacteriaceae bacterium]